MDVSDGSWKSLWGPRGPGRVRVVLIGSEGSWKGLGGPGRVQGVLGSWKGLRVHGRVRGVLDVSRRSKGSRKGPRGPERV
jgi:hypothetical protein